jgi:anaerobic magnesium-protoporphyrin IX monomethyl ester cyclase
MERKNVRIALVNPPLLPGVMWHRLTVPIGLACLAAVVEKGGYAVKIVDCSALDMDFDKMKREVASFEPDIVGITSLTATFSSALRAAHELKESCPAAFTVLGGPHATIRSVDIINENVDVDVVVRGEGEETLLELAGCVAEERKFDEVAGITFRKNGNTVQTPDRPFIQNLDELPYPAYHLLPLEKYRPAGSFFGKRILPIMSSRGCPFDCSFCVSSRMFGKMFRARSPKNVVDELEWLKNEHGAEAFSFYDDTLTLDKERCHKIFEQMQKRRVDLPWDCFTRTDQISKELLIKMKRAGCQFVTFGVESGSTQLLEAMGKGTTVEQNENAIKWAKEAGLLVATSVVVGYPGETVETLKETFDFIYRVRPNAVYLCAATPFPGTALYELVKNLGWKMSEDWNQYNTVDFTFENPSLPNEYMKKTRKKFYDRFYSPLYILRHFNKNNLYSGILVRVALSHYFWRIKSRF